MPPSSAEVVVCGAGIAGIAAAWELAVRRGIQGVLLVDERPPLSLTSDKSTECYRDWWPGPDDAMVRLVGRSIDLLEELAEATSDAFAMHRAGYAYFTARSEVAEAWEALAPAAGGADLVQDRDRITTTFPFLTRDVVAMLAPRRCGWLSAQQLGMVLLEQAREAGVDLCRGRVIDVEVAAGRVAGVRLAEAGVERVATPCFVNAAGPCAASVARPLGLTLPVICELHAKLTFTDHLGILPRELPLMIWSDPVRLPWSAEDRAGLEADPELSWLLEELPGGVHFRPEGGEGSQALLLLWAYELSPREPVWPPRFDPLYPQVVLRGVARMVPAFSAYLEGGRAPYVDGGYYCKTRDNRPLVGPMGPQGSYLLAALSGYGIMASLGAAELLGGHLTGGELPSWAAAFSPDRFDDPEYRARLETWDAAEGQL